MADEAGPVEVTEAPAEQLAVSEEAPVEVASEAEAPPEKPAWSAEQSKERIAEIAAKRAAQREARQQALAEQSREKELKAYEQQLAQRRQELESYEKQIREGLNSRAEAFNRGVQGADPLAAIRALGFEGKEREVHEQLTRAALQMGTPEGVEARVQQQLQQMLAEQQRAFQEELAKERSAREAIENQWKEATSRQQAMMRQEAERSLANVFKSEKYEEMFEAFGGDEGFPDLLKHSDQIAEWLATQKKSFTLHDVADVLLAEYENQEKRRQAYRGRKSAQAAPSSSSAEPDQASRAVRPSGTKATLTNEMASSAGAKVERKLSAKERQALADQQIAVALKTMRL